MKVVADIKNISYYENRAIECIQSVQHELSDGDQMIDMLGKAITLLTLSIEQRMKESKQTVNQEPNQMGI